MAKKIPLVEMFGPTIQGEGSVIGTQTIFLRFGGCDYQCDMCDSLHAVIPQIFSHNPNTEFLTQDELYTRVINFVGMTPWVTLSGGNPCMWELGNLIHMMQVDFGLQVTLETQGSLWKDWVKDCNKVTVSPKGPGMGTDQFKPEEFNVFVEALSMRSLENFTVKVVVFDQRDLEFVKYLLTEWPQIKNRMYISIGNIDPPEPANRYHEEDISREQLVMQTLDNMRLITEEVLGDPSLSSVKVLPQLHTLVWGNLQGK